MHTEGPGIWREHYTIPDAEAEKISTVGDAISYIEEHSK